MQLLLNAKADVNPSSFIGATAIHIAAQVRDTRILELLQSCGASIESEDTQGCRPLHYAVYSNSRANLQLLLEEGANINAANSFGATTLMLGVVYNAHEALKLLLREETLDYNCKDCDGNSVLDFAATFGDLETLYILQSSRRLKTVDSDVDNALGYAVQRRDHNKAQSISMLKTMDKDLPGSEEWEASTKEELMDDDKKSELHDNEDDDDDDDDGESELWEDAQESRNGSTI
ncbi:ankyrin repeat-containing domain protein [Usnea florida]